MERNVVESAVKAVILTRTLRSRNIGTSLVVHSDSCVVCTRLNGGDRVATFSMTSVVREAERSSKGTVYCFSIQAEHCKQIRISGDGGTHVANWSPLRKTKCW